MEIPAREEWPMPDYDSAWKTFRRLSDENQATAQHLVKKPLWPRKDGLVVCDVGCGDGRLLEALLLESPTKVAEARLIDPDLEFLKEAEVCVSDTGLVPRVSVIHGTAEEHFASCASKADAVLVVHVVYLMVNGTFKKMLEACPANTPVYIVLDAPHSVFTQLWEKTAVKYHNRAKRAHETIRNLPRDEFTVNESTFSSRIRNPLAIQRADLRAAILSIMSYSPMTGDVPAEIDEWVTSTLGKHTAGDYVLCESACYEIQRREI